MTAVIVRAVADRTDREPTDLRPLGDSIDADAVESLFSPSTGYGARSLTFVYEGCRVTVDPDAVTVEDGPTA